MFHFINHGLVEVRIKPSVIAQHRVYHNQTVRSAEVINKVETICICRGEQIAGIKASNCTSSFFHSEIIFGISSVRSRKENSGYWVWLDNTAVGKWTHLETHRRKDGNDHPSETPVRLPTSRGRQQPSLLYSYILSILLFFLHLPHENRLHHFGNSFFGTRHHRHLPAVAAHYAFLLLTAHSIQRLTQTVPMVAEPQMPRSLHPQLPRRTKAIPLRAKIISPTADVGNNGLLHLLPDSTNRNKDSIVPCRCGVTWHILSFKTLK